jgi:uroporphyrinogen-III synthase
MDKITKILENLNLIYYEYDSGHKTFIVDKTYPKNDIHNEFIKLTYNLTKNNIKFFVDEKGDIVISYKDDLITRIKQRVKNTIFSIKNKDKNIFVLSDKKVKFAKNLPVIKIKHIKQNIDFEKYDALIFTSKNAISAVDAINKKWKKIPAYVIAPQTAKAVKHYGGTLKLVGKKKHGDEFAEEIKEELKEKRVLYLGGTKTVSNLVSILNDNGVICENIAIYETICKKYKRKTKLPRNSTVIFSSPSTIDCFLENFAWDESYKAVSIGKTTAKFFPEYIKPYISETTSLESCVKKAIELNNDK